MASRLKRARRLLTPKDGVWNIHENFTHLIIEDRIQETDGLNWLEAKEMFEKMKIGMVVGIRTFDFPYVGEVVEFNNVCLTLKNAVQVLWDGRHGEFWGKGKPPQSAEIEETLPLIYISVDDVRLWGPYPGNKIPKAQ